VAVPDRLAGNLAAVSTDIKTTDFRVLPRKDVFFRMQQTVHIQQFRLSQTEEVKHMSFWDDQGMTLGHREAVPNSVGKFILSNDPLPVVSLDVTEKAVVGHNHHNKATGLIVAPLYPGAPGEWQLLNGFLHTE